MERPIFILGSHKSGTSLLRSLLDGADELFTIPIETHFFQYGGYWVDYALRRSYPASYTLDDLVASLTAHIRATNQSPPDTSRTGDNVLAGQWNVGRFSEYLRDRGTKHFEQTNIRGVMDSYVEAIHVALFDSPPQTKRFVEKSVEHAEYATLLHRLYPEAIFIHVMRNPYATLVATRKHTGQGYYPFLGKILEALENSYYYLYKNPPVIPGYKILRYEDLVTNPQETMRDVATLIEIPFTESLLEPTVMGSAWGGNSTSGESFQGISTRPLTAWQGEISGLEIAFVNRLFPHILRDYGYERLEGKSPLLIPCSHERLKPYVMNRVLWQLAKRLR